jgi:isochorismate synthase
VKAPTRGPAAEATGPTASMEAPDLLAGWRPGDFLMERRGRGVLGAGPGLTIEVPPGSDQAATAARLAERALSQSAQLAPLVAGALPYRGDQPALLVVPERAVVTPAVPQEAGWAGELEPPAEPVPGADEWPPAAPISPRLDPGGVVLRLHWRPEPAAADFAAVLAEALRRIEAGELEKVVLARSLAAVNPGIDLGALLAELRRRDPGCWLFAAQAAGGGVFLGATPETLIRRRGSSVLSLPHAGTAARAADPGEDRRAAQALLSSVKERHEHRVVVEAVAESLGPHCSELRVDPEPHLAATAAVWHLASAVRGRLRPSAPGSLGLAAALHPTPAVCGTPAPDAAALINLLEPSGRGLYAGLVGWMDERGDGEWAVSLRCALVTADRVRLHAGVGIVAESDPQSEVAETEAKFRTLLGALRALGYSESE